MALTEATLNALLDELDETGAIAIEAASLHTADPGSTGTNEVVGGTPAYARKTLVLGAAAGASKGAAMVTFDVPAATTITHFGLWTSGGTFRGGAALPANETYGAQGTYDLSITLTAT